MIECYAAIKKTKLAILLAEKSKMQKTVYNMILFL